MADDKARAKSQISRRLQNIDNELADISDFVEFAASEDWQYRKAEARREALVAEKNRLNEILGDL